MILNYIWIAFFLVGFLVALYKMIALGDMSIFTNLSTALFDSAKTGFTISLGLTGVMALWLGIMKVGEKAGVIGLFAKLVRPFFKTIFKDVPKESPAYGSITMNFSANMLGLDNAATPLGLQAMKDLQAVNPQKDRASDAQIMFLVLNTVGITLIPTSIIAVSQAIAIEQGVVGFNAADIFLPLLITTYIGFALGLIITASYQRTNIFKLPVMLFLLLGGLFVFCLAAWLKSLPAETMSLYVGAIGSFVIVAIVIAFLVAGLVKRLQVYDLFVEGAKEGFVTAVKIIPYLIAMLAAISMFRASGCMDYLVGGIAQIIAVFGLNTEFVPALPVGIMKPLSGSGARGLMVDVMQQYGVDSFPGKMAAIMQGSTETTFYVLAVYFGSVNIKNTRYALACGLICDLLSIIITVIVGYMFFYKG